MKDSVRVRLVNNRLKEGNLTGREQMRRNRRMLQVQFTDGLRWVPEDQVEPVGEVRLSPLDMLEQRSLGLPSDLRRTLNHVKLSGRLADVIYSLEATRTDFYAYQFKPVIKILESPSNGILIADEVGLGKTIEAGLIWTELRSRFDMKRLVVLCPAALREKWRFELSSKIGVNATICDAKDVMQLLADESGDIDGFAVIASHQGLRPPRGWQDSEIKRPAAELARLLQQNEANDRIVDLLIIDEAHHMRNPETQTNLLGRLVKGISEYCVLLTATPVHNKSLDLFSVLRLLDPDTFTRLEVLNQILESNAPLVKARDQILGGDADKEVILQLVGAALEYPLLKDNRQLTLLQESIAQADLSHAETRSRLAYRIETVNLLAHVITRTRKKDVKEWRVIREPVPEIVEITDVERRFYDVVTAVVTEYAQERAASERFLLAQPQRQMTSSMAGALLYWRQRRAVIEAFEDEEDYDDAETRSMLGPLATEIVTRCHDCVSVEELVSCDSKYERLRHVIRNLLEHNPDEKIVVFASFRATLTYLSDRLAADSVSCITLMGGQELPKDQTIADFERSDGPSVLLSSEVGGEGVDLQFSKILINYDLPWNPMRVEQRIGRIDRLGQEADKVLIWNLICKETIDYRIYQRLYEKLDLCRNALGDFDAILGEELRKLEIDLLTSGLTTEEQERRIDQTAQALANLRQEEQRLEDEAAGLVAYGDYILNQVHAAKNLNRWISGSDIRQYVFDYLRLNYPGCDIRRTREDEEIYEIELSKDARYDLARYIEDHRSTLKSKLALGGARPIACHFDSHSIGPTRRGVEVIGQFHPFVRMISAKVSSEEQLLTPATAIRVSAERVGFDIHCGTYLLAASLWSFRGLQDSERIAFAAQELSTDSPHRLSAEEAERLSACAANDGEDWLEAVNTVDLEMAYGIANHQLFYSLDKQFEIQAAELRARNEDRADIQLRSLEQNLETQTEQLTEIARKHRDEGRDSLARATEGRLEALRNRVDIQRRKIDERRELSSESMEIALAVVDVYNGA